jgi:ferritin-like metal-binding protein YciE
MKKDIFNLHRLMVRLASDLYNSEKQQLKFFENLYSSASSYELKYTIQQHFFETEMQIHRLENIFHEINEPVIQEHSHGMDALIRQTFEMISRSDDAEITDAAMALCLQQIEHYEIAGYNSLYSHSKLLGMDQISKLLQKTLIEEKNFDNKISNLAENILNLNAKVPVQGMHHLMKG